MRHRIRMRNKVHKPAVSCTTWSDVFCGKLHIFVYTFTIITMYVPAEE